MDAGGDQSAGVNPVSPGSRMSTRARPPLTATSGAPSALRVTVTRGLLPGGAGGSVTSVVMVPASSMMRMRTAPPETSMPPGGAEAGRRDHGRFAVLCKTVGNGECGIAPRGRYPCPRPGPRRMFDWLGRRTSSGDRRRLARWPFPAPRRGYRLRSLQCCGSGMRSRNRRYSGSLRRLHTTGIDCGFRAYGFRYRRSPCRRAPQW